MVIFLLSLISGAVFGIAQSSEYLFDGTNRQFELDDVGRRLMNRLSLDLRSANAESVVPVILDNSTTVSFQQVVGYDGNDVLLGPVISFTWWIAAGEEANGLDDNGNGLADEGDIVMTVDSSDPTILASNILDLRFNPTPSGIMFSVVCAARNRRGLVITEEFQQGVSFRN